MTGWSEIVPRLLDVGGILVVSVLLVWRIDARMAGVEGKLSELCSLLKQYLKAERRG